MTAKKSNRRRTRHTSLPSARRAGEGNANANSSKVLDTVTQPFLPGFEWMAESKPVDGEAKPPNGDQVDLTLNPECPEFKLKIVEEYMLQRMLTNRMAISTISSTVCKGYGLGVTYDSVFQLVTYRFGIGDETTLKKIEKWTKKAWLYAKENHDSTYRKRIHRDSIIKSLNAAFPMPLKMERPQLTVTIGGVN